MEYQSSIATPTAIGSSQLIPLQQEAILATLEKCSNALTVYQHTMKKPLTMRRDVAFSIDCVFSDSDIENDDLSSNVAKNLKSEIHEKETLNILSQELEKSTIRDDEGKVLLEEAEKFRQTAADLRKTIATENTIREAEKNRLMKELAEEERQREKLKLIANAESRYVAAWEKARCEQNSLRCDMEIQELEKILKECRVREENEKRVYTELTRFLTQHIACIEGKIKEWEEKYDREQRIYENNIWTLQTEIEQRQKKLNELKEEYRSNQEFIDAYQAEKEALRKEKEKEELKQRSAIKVQAWWRGVMVCRKLGPYRPEEKKKKRTAKMKK